MGWLNQKKHCNWTMKLWEWTIINTGFAKQNVAIQAAELGIKPSSIVCLSRQKCQETKHGEFHQQPWNKWFNIQQESFVYGLFLKWHHGNHGSIYSRTMKRCDFWLSTWWQAREYSEHGAHCSMVPGKSRLSCDYHQIEWWIFQSFDCQRIPPGKRLHNYGNSPCLMGKLTINGHVQ